MKGRNQPELVPEGLLELLEPARDQWNYEEVLKLNESIEMFVTDEIWAHIANHVPTKSRSQISNYIKSNLAHKTRES